MEAALYELAPSNWYVIENRLNGNGFLEGVFENQEEMQLAVKELESVSPIRLDLSQGLRTERLEDRDWKEAYKHHHHIEANQNFGDQAAAAADGRAKHALLLIRHHRRRSQRVLVT